MPMYVGEFVDIQEVQTQETQDCGAKIFPHLFIVGNSISIDGIKSVQQH